MKFNSSSYIEQNNEIVLNEDELEKIKTISEYLFMD